MKYLLKVLFRGLPVTRDSQHRSPATLLKTFHEERGRILSRGRQNMCKRLWHAFKISQKAAWRVKIWCVVVPPGRKPHWHHPASVKSFYVIFFQGT